MMKGRRSISDQSVLTEDDDEEDSEIHVKNSVKPRRHSLFGGMFKKSGKDDIPEDVVYERDPMMGRRPSKCDQKDSKSVPPIDNQRTSTSAFTGSAAPLPKSRRASAPPQEPNNINNRSNDINSRRNSTNNLDGKTVARTTTRNLPLIGRNPIDFDKCDAYPSPGHGTRTNPLAGRNPKDFDGPTDPYGNPIRPTENHLTGRNPRDFDGPTDPYGNPIRPTDDNPLAGRNPRDFGPTDPYGNPIRPKENSLAGRNPRDFDGLIDAYDNPIRQKDNPLAGRNPVDFDGIPRDPYGNPIRPKDVPLASRNLGANDGITNGDRGLQNKARYAKPDPPAKNDAVAQREKKQEQEHAAKKKMETETCEEQKRRREEASKGAAEEEKRKHAAETLKKNVCNDAARESKEEASREDKERKNAAKEAKAKKAEDAAKKAKLLEEAAGKAKVETTRIGKAADAAARKAKKQEIEFGVKQGGGESSPEDDSRRMSYRGSIAHLKTVPGKQKEDVVLKHAEAINRDTKKDMPEWVNAKLKKNPRRNTISAPPSEREKFSLPTYHTPRGHA
jgi:hypothetical protein